MAIERECLRCGSQKLMPNVPLQDHYGDLGMKTRPAEVAIDGNPQAWFFKESSSGTLFVTICGDCGYAELSVSNYRELWAKYLQQREPRA